MDNEVKKLYSALIGKGYTTRDLGDEQTFMGKMQDADNRRQLYDWVNARGDFRIGSYEDYEKRLTAPPAPKAEDINPTGDKSGYTFTAAELGVPDNTYRSESTSVAKLPEIKPINVKLSERQLKELPEPERNKAIESGSFLTDEHKKAREEFDKGLTPIQRMQMKDGSLSALNAPDIPKNLKYDYDFKKEFGYFPGGSDTEFWNFLKTKTGEEYQMKMFGRPLSDYEIAKLSEDARRLGFWGTVKQGFKGLGYGLKGVELELAEGIADLFDVAHAKENINEERERILTAQDNFKPTAEGFGGFVAEMIPQMVGTGAGILVSTVNPALGGALITGSTAAQVASSMGSEALEARRYGASDGQVALAMLMNGAVELATEKYVNSKYLKRVLPKASSVVAEASEEAVSREFDSLLDAARKELGGKFTAKTAKEFVKDVLEEGGSEFAAEALQTLVPMIYQHPKDYPTLAQVLENGWEGAKGGFFMGGILGGASTAVQRRVNNKRRAAQGFVDVANVTVKDENGGEQNAVVEILGKDENGKIVALMDNEQVIVDESDIKDRAVYDYDFFTSNEVAFVRAEGYNATDDVAPQIKRGYDMERERAVQTLGEDVVAALDNDPAGTLAGMNDVDRVEAMDYVNARARYEGMIDRISDDIDERIKVSDKEIDFHKNRQDGAIHPAMMRGVNGAAPKRVYIVGGSVATLEDGTIDKTNSSSMIIVRDADTGEVSAASADDLESLEAVIDAEAEKKSVAEQIANQVATEKAAVIEAGSATSGGNVSPVEENAPVIDKKARRTELEKMIPVKGKKKQFTEVEPAVTAEYISLLTDDVAKQVATADKYIAMIQEAQQKADPIEALEMDEQIAYWNGVKSLLAPQESEIAAPVEDNTPQSQSDSSPTLVEQPTPQATNEMQEADLENAEKGEKGQKAVETVEENNESTISQTSDQVGDQVAEGGNAPGNGGVAKGRRKPKGFRSSTKKSSEELFAEEKEKAVNGIYSGDYAKVLAESNSIEEAISQFNDMADAALAQAEKWASRQYKKNNTVVTGQNAQSAADEYETTIGAANERRREANIKRLKAEAETLRGYAKTLVERTDYSPSTVEIGQSGVPVNEEVGPFGRIYRQFKGKAKEAIQFLLGKKEGEAVGALSHPEIGEIDLVWGEEGTSNSDGYGLAKLAKFHPEVLDNLQEIINDMRVTRRSANRVQLESDTHQAAVRLTWDNKSKNWLLTAFEKKNSVSGNTTDTGETSNGGKQNDTATLQNTVSTDKDTTQSAKVQEKAKKSGEDELDIYLAEIKAAQERQKAFAQKTPPPSFFVKAYTENDAEAIKKLDKQFNDVLQTLVPMDIPAIEATIKGMKERKRLIKDNENPNYKAFDHIEKALAKRKKQLEKELTEDDKRRLDIIKRGNRGELKETTQPKQENKPVESEPIKDETPVTSETTEQPETGEVANAGPVNRETLQLNMSEEDFNALLNSGDKAAVSEYLAEMDGLLRIGAGSPLDGRDAIVKEYRGLVEQYGGEENIPADVVAGFDERIAPYNALQRAVFDRKYALQDKLREIEASEAQAKEQAEKEAKAEHKQTAFGGFLAGKTDLGASAAEKALNKKYNFDGKVMTVAEFVEDAVGRGDVKLSTVEEPKYKGASRAAWNRMDARQQEADAKRVKESGTKTVYTVNDHDLGKTAYDYAKFLQEKKAAEQKPKEKIEDVGEVLAGARKDELKVIASSFENATVKSLIELPFSKAFKKPDLKKAVERGALREEDALFYEAMFNALINSSKPKNSVRHRNAVEKWAEETYNSLQLIKSFVEADEAARDRAMAEALEDKFPARTEELAVIEKRKVWNARNNAEWGDKTTPNPVWVAHEVLKALGYKPGDKVEIPFGVLKANVFATGYEFYNKKGERLIMQSVPTVEEGIERIVWLSKIKRGDADTQHPVASFFATPTKRDMGDSGRYYVLYGTVRNPKRSEFGSKEEADAFAANHKEAIVRPIQEVVKRYGYKIAFRNPLTGDKFYVNDMEFETEGEAMQYLEENYDAVNEQTNELLAKERGEAKKEVSADDLLEVAMVHGKDGWKYAVNIKGKYANNMGMPLLLREFDTREDAKAFLNESKNEVFEVYKKQQAEQKKFVFFDTGENSRIGEDYRGGRDVTAKDFMDTFGFRGVQFGNWTNQEDRQMAVNQAFDAFMDLAKLLGVSPKALSLNGELGMAFGSRGSGFGNAHYEPGEIVINLTKTRGAGSLAHEWWHALDNYFARRANVPMGMVTDSRSIDMRPELRQAYNELLKMIEKSDFYKRSKAKGDYWGRMHEVTARLMAEWVDQSLKDRGELNTFLSRGVNEERYKRMNYDVHRAVALIKGKEALSYEEFEKTPEALAGFPYPSRAELKEFGDAMRNIFETVEEQETEEGDVVLYRSSEDEIRFSKVTPEMDAEYMSAVENGDIETAERLVKEAAKMAMPDTKVVDEDGYPMVVYHGSPSVERFNEFDATKGLGLSLGSTTENSSRFTFFASTESAAKAYKDGGPTGEDYIGEGNLYEVYLDLKNPRVVDFDGLNWTGDGVEAEYFDVLFGEWMPLKNGELDYFNNEVNALKEYRRIFGAGKIDESKCRVKLVKLSPTTNEVAEEALAAGHDGVIIKNVYDSGYHEGPITDYVSFSPNQIKSAGAVSYDDNGNVSPLGERFNEGKNDIRFRKVFHGSGAQFDKFGHSFMRTGAGAGPLTDREVVMESDPYSKVLGKPRYYGKKQREYVARQRRRMADKARQVAEKLNLDNVEVLESTEGLTGKKATSKGWFDPRTGKITVVVPNHGSTGDIVETVLHEAVAHYGLRKLFGENFKNFLDNVYRNVTPEIRAEITELAKKHGWDFHTATEEYLASLAENTNFEKVNPSLWSNIKSFFMKMLAKVGITLDEPLGDNELRYILWRSHQNLVNPGWFNVFGQAEDIAKQYELGVGNYASGEVKTENGSLPSVAEATAPLGQGSSLAAEDEIRFSKATPEMDAEYMAAVENGDMETAERLVREAAKLAMPGTKVVDEDGFPKVVYHGSRSVERFNVFNAADSNSKSIGSVTENSDRFAFFADTEDAANVYKDAVSRGEEFAGEGKLYSVYLDIKNPAVVDFNGLNWTGKGVQVEYFDALFGEWMPLKNGELDYFKNDIYALAEYRRIFGAVKVDESNWRVKEVDIITSTNEFAEQALAEGKDGAIIYNVYDSGQGGSPIAEYVAFSPNQIKSAEAVTYDDNGNVIPLGERFNEDKEDIRFREGSAPGSAREEYERKVRRPNKSGSVGATENVARRAQEAYQDSMLALNILQDAVARETGNEVKDNENAYIAENRMSSSNKAMVEIYERDFFMPLMDEINALIKEGVEYDDIIRYLHAKHGLERNEYMRRKQAEEAARRELGEEPAMPNEGDADYEAKVNAKAAWRANLAELTESYVKKFAKRDYSGLTALTETANAKDAEAAAQQMVDEFENDHDTTPLWKAVNKATKETLRREFVGGLIDRATYDTVSTMFDFYIPLRGWDENVAANEYEYFTNNNTPVFTPAVKTAKGRPTLSDDPIATIGYMAGSAIARANRNLMKQKFLNFVMNNPTSLATVSEQWYTMDYATNEWVPNNPAIPEDATPEQVVEIVEAHEANMRALEKAGKATRERSGLKIGLHATKQEQQQHVVRVMRNGKEYAVYINGNPRAAQALNGMTNPDVSKSKAREAAQKVENFMARAFTSRNPAFIISNSVRDVIWAGTAVAAKEDAEYTKQYTKNVTGVLAKFKLPRLLRKFRNGTLDMNNEIERYFDEFLRNGGETGFTQVLTVEDYKKNIARFTKEAKNGTRISNKAWRGLWNGIEFLNRSAEDITRFTVYMTSRQMGRSIARSVYDAKEITVNFNKKGSGEMGARYLNFAYIFFNATIQSLANFGKLVYRHPGKMAAALGTYSMMGFLMPVINAALMALGDDDDEENYWNLPEWVRRNNIVLFVPWTEKGFITIPLPHEIRPFYGMGENAMSALQGKQTTGDAIKKSLVGFTGMLPIDFTANGGDVVVNAMPTILQPLAQVRANVTHFGTPIYKDNDFNKRYPSWTKAYKGTNSTLVAATKWLNELGGGNNVDSGGLLDWNPAVIEHLFESYLGGMGKTFNKVATTVSMIWDEEARIARNIPVASSFYQESDERTAGSQLNREYFDALEELEGFQHRLSGYQKEITKGNAEYEKLFEDLVNSDEFMRYSIIKDYSNAIRELDQVLKNNGPTEEEAQDIEGVIQELKNEMLDELEKLQAEE